MAGLFVKAFQAAPEDSAEVKSRLWEKCFALQYIPWDWRTAFMIAIYKQGSKE